MMPDMSSTLTKHFNNRKGEKIMKTQTTVSHPIHAGRGKPAQKQFTRYLIVAASLIMVLITSACAALAVPVAENQLDVPAAAEQTNRVEAAAAVQRAFAADAARYSGLANAYLSGKEAAANRTTWDHPRDPHLVETLAGVPQRMIEAETARYNGLTTFYSSENGVNRQQAMEAETARYNGLTISYSSENGVNRQQAMETETARYNGLATLYPSEDSIILAANPELAITQRYAAMVEWHRLHHPGR
jgi:hypothetical protein